MYQSSATGVTRPCHLGRDKDSLLQHSVAPEDSTWLDTSVDIGGTAVSWRYKNFGAVHHDACMEAVSRAGASMATPHTLGIAWPSGAKFWVPSSLMCNTYWFISEAQSGGSFSYDNLGSGVRSATTASCLGAFVRSVSGVR